MMIVSSVFIEKGVFYWMQSRESRGFGAAHSTGRAAPSTPVPGQTPGKGKNGAKNWGKN